MDEIEVLIKIPKEDYEFIYDEFADGDMPDGKSLTRTTLYAIANGTVLPKGHEDLVSRVEVLEKLHEYFDPLADGEDICPADIYHEINVLNKIIEADTESEG